MNIKNKNFIYLLRRKKLMLKNIFIYKETKIEGDIKDKFRVFANVCVCVCETIKLVYSRVCFLVSYSLPPFARPS